MVRNLNIFLPISDKEVERLKKYMQEHEGKKKVTIREGDTVRIISGVFAGQVAKVESIDPYSGKLQVLITMLGTEVPHILTLEEVEKL